MPQTRLYLTALRKTADALYAAMEAAFEEDGLPLAITEADERAGLFEVSVYADGDGADIAPRLAALVAEHAPGAEVGREELDDRDWVAVSLEGLKPVRAGRVLVHGAHDRGAVRIGDIGIEIEAGLAFGTGHHGTTSGCLEVIQKVLRRERPRNALDLGTGSGVLAIALARLAPMRVLATDIDPVAVKVTKDNARLNGVFGRIAAETAPGFHHPVFAANAPFDLIVANILARPLMQLAPEMAQRLAPGGSLVLSGILDTQRDMVLAAYSGQRFRHVATLWREGWVTLHLKR